MEIRKVMLVINGVFPTYKAYGVTTQNTLNSLQTMNIEAKCLCLQNKESSLTNNRNDLLFYSQNFISELLLRYSKKSFGIMQVLAWKIAFRICTWLTSENIERYRPDLIWIRDASSLKFIRSLKLEPKIVFEIHHPLNRSAVRDIKKIGHRNIVLAPISSILEANIKTHGLRSFSITLSPMGIDERLFSRNADSPDRTIKVSNQVVTLGYFGKIAPIGHSKGVEDIFNLALLHKEMNFCAQYRIVGLSDEEISNIREFLKSKDFNLSSFDLIKHLPHDQVPNEMFKCDVLVLPHQQDPKYSGSPIKGVEYASTGIPILAADSKANKALFNEGFEPYWYSHKDILSMHSSLLKALSSEDKDLYSEESKRFAFKRTWQNRTRRIVKAVELLEKN